MKKIFTTKFYLQLINELISRIKLYWNKQTDQYHWFEVRYVYYKNDARIFDYVTQIGVMELKTMANARVLKKIPVPLHKNPKLRWMLGNGNLVIEINCYLGKYKK